MAAEDGIVTACLIIIGNEILSGRTEDANLPFLARRLNEVGVRLADARVIPDVEDTIVDTVNECRARYDYVFTTGGIGPTHDDITGASIAKAFGVGWALNDEAHRILTTHYQMTGAKLNEARLKMAYTPLGAELIENPVSKAPGYRLENVYVFAGIPSVMQAMFESIAHTLTGGAPVLSRTVAATLPEGTIAADLGALQERYPGIDIGSYPFYRAGKFGCSLVLRTTDETALDAAAGELAGIIRDLGEQPIFGEEGDTT
ncbi:MAG: molybdopterin-binding protein [Alphaproteobacteria bacterium]|jgi:molybdenum cofactor synthesis domain-containing protein|nr:competence/damage-inducible protein A [Rhodospirillaceae bacterium]MDP6403956.1 molybdopterin-binding protein [Alphaproteobacteria bacterium]MDP6621355.1 molybdopterin-binding protein [Alphaproteobacteria bacterium]|tara:strand:+ start:515 stop:1291 length:777 start_codon:yes stop_codon:yes gene_type:complete